MIIKAEEDFNPSSNVWRYESFESLSLEGVQNQTKDQNFKMENSEFQQWRYSNFERFNIILKFNGIKKIILRIPIINDHIDISNLHSNDFDFRLIN